MAVRTPHRPARYLRRGATLLLGLVILLSLGLWLATTRWRTGDLSFAVPLAPARELYVNIWKPVADDKSWGYDGMVAHQIDRPLTAMVWYQHRGLSSSTRLATVELPTWPLLAIAGGYGGVLLIMMARRRLRRDRSSTE